MTEYVSLINSALKNYLKKIENETLQKAIEYALFPGGKRLRPAIVLTILDDLKLDLNLGINQAIAIEMIHTYSLIHDDLPSMDNDTLRRGRPTLHIEFGEATAILAADALLTDSFFYFCQGAIPPIIKNEIVILASTNAGVNGMVKGQTLDMASSKKTLSTAEVEEIHLRKTRDLLNISIKIPAIIAGFDNKKLKLLDDLSFYFGLGFQIKDDINDLEKTSLELGKDAQSDLKNDKATYPKIFGLARSKILLSTYKQEALNITKDLFGIGEFYKIIERTL